MTNILNLNTTDAALLCKQCYAYYTGRHDLLYCHISMLLYNFFNKTHFLVYFIKFSTELQNCLQNLYTSKIVYTGLTIYIYDKEQGERYKT